MLKLLTKQTNKDYSKKLENLLEARFLVIAWTITFLSLLLRIIKLDQPKSLAYDERYYPVQAYSLLHFGYEKDTLNHYGSNNPIDLIGQKFAEGDHDIFLNSGYFSSHPPLGKLIIGVGELLGSNPIFWRLPSAITGSLSILLLILTANHLLNSKKSALLAGGILAIDPLALSINRLGMLDSILEFFIIAAAYTWIKNKGYILSSKLSYKTLSVISILLGAATAVKWSGAYYLLSFLTWTLLQYFHSQKQELELKNSNFKKSTKKIYSFLSLTILSLTKTFFLGVIAVIVYLSSWTSWLASHGGYMRNASQLSGETVFKIVPSPLRDLLLLHKEMLKMHLNFSENDEVPEASRWFFFPTPMAPQVYKDKNGFISGVFYLSPLIYTIALILLCIFVIALLRKIILKTIVKKDMKIEWEEQAKWIVPSILSIIGYLPWVFTSRVSYMFYAIVFAPYIAIILAIGFQKMFYYNRKIFVLSFTVWLSLLILQTVYFAPFWTLSYISYKYSGLYYWLYLN